MLQKEDSRRLGWALIILSFAILIGSLSSNFGSITGYYTYNQGTITTESVDVYVGDTVIYTGCTGGYVSATDTECSARVENDNCIIDADSIGSCVTEFSLTYTITLNIDTTLTVAAQGATTSNDGNTNVAYVDVEDGIDSSNMG